MKFYRRQRTIVGAVGAVGKDENEIQSMISNFVENDASKKVKIKSVKKRLKSLETIVKDSKNETNDAAEKTAQ